jgi:hypothetical protein
VARLAQGLVLQILTLTDLFSALPVWLPLPARSRTPRGMRDRIADLLPDQRGVIRKVLLTWEDLGAEAFIWSRSRSTC